jgi:DNA-binding transcriptional regulator YiaG
MRFGRPLRALRKEAGLSHAELARRAGGPASTLRNWEGGRVRRHSQAADAGQAGEGGASG